MSFRFKCYKDLKTTLGEIDSIVESIELASREFIEAVSINGYSKECIQNNITALSIKHNIKVNHLDINKFTDRIIKLHIINVYEQLENYLESLIKEHPSIKNKTKKQENETELDFIIRILNLGNILKNTIEYKIVNHYRIIRNYFIHASDKETSKYLKSINLKETEYKNLSAPNTFDKLTFDDFILFTRSIKNFARLMNEHAKPDDAQLIQLIRATYQSKINKFSNNIKRKQNLIKQLVSLEYNLNDEELIAALMKD